MELRTRDLEYFQIYSSPVARPRHLAVSSPIPTPLSLVGLSRILRSVSPWFAVSDLCLVTSRFCSKNLGCFRPRPSGTTSLAASIASPDI